MITTTRVTAEIKFLGVYTCSVCGTEQQGTTARKSLDVSTLYELIATIQKFELRAHDMPIGWAHYGNGVFKCAACGKPGCKTCED